MKNWKKYQRTNLAEMRPITRVDIETPEQAISISEVDMKNGSPKIGDMVARNPLNHMDKWLVAEKYFKENFAEVGARSYGDVFVDHIFEHLQPGETVVCKICHKTLGEIVSESC